MLAIEICFHNWNLAKWFPLSESSILVFSRFAATKTTTTPIPVAGQTLKMAEQAWGLLKGIGRRLHKGIGRRLHKGIGRRLHKGIGRRLHKGIGRCLPQGIGRCLPKGIGRRLHKGIGRCLPKGRLRIFYPLPKRHLNNTNVEQVVCTQMISHALTL